MFRGVVWSAGENRQWCCQKRVPVEDDELAGASSMMNAAIDFPLLIKRQVNRRNTVWPDSQAMQSDSVDPVYGDGSCQQPQPLIGQINMEQYEAQRSKEQGQQQTNR